jgi:hypothetical protein
MMEHADAAGLHCSSTSRSGRDLQSAFSLVRPKNTVARCQLRTKNNPIEHSIRHKSVNR